jgi:hypothetical protein
VSISSFPLPCRPRLSPYFYGSLQHSYQIAHLPQRCAHNPHQNTHSFVSVQTAVTTHTPPFLAFRVSHPRVESNDDDGSPTEDRYTFVEGLYWVCITGTTVGFGDFSPETQDARLFAIFYLIFLVTATGGFLGEVGRHMDADRGSKRDEVLNRGLSVALIAELDEDGDGEVTRIEWLKGMLVALDEADGELIDIILQQFDNLDVDKSGSLDMEDIRAATEQAAAGIDVDSSPEESFADRVNAHVDGRDDKHNMKIGVHRI